MSYLAKHAVISERNKGILCILGAACFFSFMTVCIRMAGDLPTMEKALFRNLVAAAIAWIILLRSEEKIVIGKKNLPALFMRAICGTTGLICNFYAVDHLNISDANLLNKLSPFFAIIMSIWILKEKPHLMEWISVIVAFLGALLVIKPGFNMDILPALLGLLGGFGAGVAYSFVRQLGKNGVRGPVIVMFFSMFSLAVTFPFFVVQYQPMSLVQLLWLLGAGASAAGGQLTITAAYTFAPAKEISVYDYTQVIFAALWGFLFFAQIPDKFSVIGYIVILAASLIKFLHGRKK